MRWAAACDTCLEWRRQESCSRMQPVAGSCARGRQWQRQRQCLVAVVRAEQQPLPVVDWRRRNLQCLFIDRTDTVRARFAVGMFERLSGWNACSQVLVGAACGVDAAEGSRLDFSTQAALFGLASGWQLRPHLFTSTRQRFEPDDIDRFDLLVCLDSGIQATVLQQVSAARPTQPATYVQRVCCLTDFLLYCNDDVLLRQGSRSVLDRQLRTHLQLVLPALRPSASKVAAAAAGAAAAVADSGTGSSASSSGDGYPAAVPIPAYMLPTGIPRPSLQGSSAAADSAAEEWERMALLLAVCCVGLIRYLLDCRPDDLPDWDPV